MSVGYNQFQLQKETGLHPEGTVMLVGAALDGPPQAPFYLKEGVAPHEVLGQSPLADAYVAAKDAGATSILAYRINGKKSEAILKDSQDREIIQFHSISASSLYNTIQLILYPTHLYVVGTTGKVRSYFFDRHPTARELAYAINRDAFYGLVEFEATVLDEYRTLSNLVSVAETLLFKGGDEEVQYINHRDPQSESPTHAETVTALLKERLKVSLFGEDPEDIEERTPVGELGVLPFGVMVLCDMFHDDDEEFTEMLGSFCENKTRDTGYGTVGVIGTRPIYPEVIDPGEADEDGDVVAETVDFDETVRVRALELVSLSESLSDMEAYKYVQVVIGHTEYVESTNSAVPIAYAYAATQAVKPYYTMMSNKQIAGFGKLNYQFGKEDIALLTRNGYTCIVPSIRRGFVPFYATSFSKDTTSTKAKPHNLRISQHISSMLTEELDRLIGNRQDTLSIKESMETANELLAALIQDGIIRDFTLSYQLTENNTLLSLEVSFTPFSEVKSISSVATISFPKGVME